MVGHNFLLKITMVSHTNNLTLKQAFESTFHSKYDFNDDFINLSSSNNYDEFNLKNITNKVIKPNSKLKNMHKFLNSFIFNYMEINEKVVFSYQKEKNVLGAVLQHKDNHYFFQTDIVNFFNAIQNADVKQMLSSNIEESPIVDFKDYIDNILSLIMVDNSLPVGFATSPNISNSFLLNFDNPFQEFCQKNNLTYTRFSDDIIVSSKDKIIGIEGIITKLLNDLFGERIKINEKKTRYIKKGQKIRLLGLDVLPNGSVTVNNRLKSEIEVFLHFYTTDQEKFKDILNERFDGKLSKISGKLNYISSIDKAYIIKLRKKYGNYVIDAFIHQTIDKL